MRPCSTSTAPTGPAHGKGKHAQRKSGQCRVGSEVALTIDVRHRRRREHTGRDAQQLMVASRHNSRFRRRSRHRSHRV